MNVAAMMRGQGAKSAGLPTKGNADKIGDYPYSNIVFYSAAAETELARDMPPGETLDGKPHGALTDSILRVVRDNSADSFNYETFFEEIEYSMEEYCQCQHSPNLLPRVLATDRPELKQKLLHNRISVKPQPQPRPQPQPQPQAASRPFTVSLDQSAESYSSALVGLSRVASPADVNLRISNNKLSAFAKNRDLIYQWPSVPHSSEVAAWLQGRSWLRSRITEDSRENRKVKLVVREGMTGKSLEEGSELFFSLSLDQPRKILLLDMFSDGTVSVIYPYYPSELAIQQPKQRITIPDEKQPIEVKPPFGTDTILLYGLTESPADNALLEEFYSARDQSFSYSSPLMKKLEKRLKQGGVSSASMKLVTYASQ